MLRRIMMMASSRKDEESGGEVKLISFTINDIQYQAQEGMTWGEWVSSQYNTNGCYVDIDDSIGYSYGWIGTSEDYVYSSEVIQEGGEYFLVG